MRIKTKGKTKKIVLSNVCIVVMLFLRPRLWLQNADLFHGFGPLWLPSLTTAIATAELQSLGPSFTYRLGTE